MQRLQSKQWKFSDVHNLCQGKRKIFTLLPLQIEKRNNIDRKKPPIMKLTLLFKVFSQKHHEVKRSYKEQPLDAKNTSCDKMINYFSEIAEAETA